MLLMHILYKSFSVRRSYTILSLQWTFHILVLLCLFTASEEKENQERNKDPGKSEGWPKYHLTVRYCQRSCGNFVSLVALPFKNSDSDLINVYVFMCNHI